MYALAPRPIRSFFFFTRTSSTSHILSLKTIAQLHPYFPQFLPIILYHSSQDYSSLLQVFNYSKTMQTQIDAGCKPTMIKITYHDYLPNKRFNKRLKICCQDEVYYQQTKSAEEMVRLNHIFNASLNIIRRPSKNESSTTSALFET